MNIRTKLLSAFAVLGLASTGITAWQAYDVARDSLEQATFERLTSVREARRTQIRQWFEDCRHHLLQVADDPAVRHAAALAAGRGADTRAVEAALSRLVAHAGFRSAVIADAASAASDPRITRAVRAALDSRDSGRCVLADVAASPLPREAPSVLIAVPLEPPPAEHAPRGAAPVAARRVADAPVAALVAFIAIDDINAVMLSGSNWREAGLGESGETYIVGADYRMRSDSRFFVQEPDRYFRLLRGRGADTTVLRRIAAQASSVLLQEARTEATEAALRGESATRIVDDYRGIPVVSSYAPLALPGVRWVILAEIDTQEAFRAIAALRERLVLWGLVALLAGLAAGVVMARSIARPVLSLARTTERFGAGDHAQRAAIATRDEIGALAATFNAMADSIERGTETLRNLSAHLQNVRENERTSIARDIHDELGQALTTLKLELRLLRDDLQRPGADPADRVAVMNDIIDATIRAVKRMITDLRPRLLDDLGLVAAVEWLAEDFARRTGIACAVAVAPRGLRLDPDRSVAVFRICQEALTNAARHSGADAVDVELRLEDGAAFLEVRDNGRGITRDAAESPSSFGLLGIAERAASWGGRVTVDGEPGRGTRLRVSIPLPQEAA